MSAYNVHPFPFYTSNYDPQKNRTVYEQSGVNPGMTVRQLYFAHIIGGLASNPTTMLNIEDHIDYAVKMAELAEKKTNHW